MYIILPCFIGSSHRIFYEMQIVGPLDHVWLLEQLANGAGKNYFSQYFIDLTMNIYKIKINTKRGISENN